MESGDLELENKRENDDEMNKKKGMTEKKNNDEGGEDHGPKIDRHAMSATSAFVAASASVSASKMLISVHLYEISLSTTTETVDRFRNSGITKNFCIYSETDFFRTLVSSLP